MNINTLKIIFILVGIIYVRSPFDFLPDLLGLVGRIDDLALIAFLIWKYRQMKSRVTANFEKLKEEHQNKSDNNLSQENFCPYKTLNIKEDANQAEIKKAYKKMIREYHPDKVDHLGEELVELANKKIREIQKAFDALKEQ